MGRNYVGVNRNGLLVIVYSILTCGIYMYYWYYTVMEDINRASGEVRINSALLLVGSIFCFPVIWVMLYQIDKNLARLAREEGTSYNENFILWLLLTFICGIGTLIAIFQITNGYNELWDKRRRTWDSV